MPLNEIRLILCRTTLNDSNHIEFKYKNKLLSNLRVRSSNYIDRTSSYSCRVNFTSSMELNSPISGSAMTKISSQFFHRISMQCIRLTFSEFRMSFWRRGSRWLCRETRKCQGLQLVSLSLTIKLKGGRIHCTLQQRGWDEGWVLLRSNPILYNPILYNSILYNSILLL